MEQLSQVAPSSVSFCGLCHKPFASELSFQRHARYCGSRTRRRPRSCVACNAAKTKCSFEKPCARCDKKAIGCFYVNTARKESQTLLPTSETILRDSPNGASIIDSSTYHEDAPVDSNLSTSFQQLVNNDISVFNYDDLVTFDTSNALDFVAPSQLQNYKHSPSMPSWCTWSQGDVSLTVLSENAVFNMHTNILNSWYAERPHAQHNADLIIQSLRSFPTAMLRAETFPWFIHRHAQYASSFGEAFQLPETLTACMGVAQMFASRTAETRSFLWKTVRSEYSRLRDTIYNLSEVEATSSLQALMVYMMMCVIDQTRESEGTILEILAVLHELYFISKERSIADALARTHLVAFQPSWREWILLESSTRARCLWFLVGLVICIKTGMVCDTTQSYRQLLLPCPRTLWEANSESTWRREYELHRLQRINGLETLGDLIDAQNASFLPLEAQKLDGWNAGNDNLGQLLNMVSTMV